VPDDRAGVEFLVSQDASKQSGLARTVSAHESNFGIAGDGALCVVQQNLVAVAFVGIANLQKDGHGNR
jgi:hypothetical protein